LCIFLSAMVAAQTQVGDTWYAPLGKKFLILGFNEPMDTTTTKVLTNYTIFDPNLNELPIYNVATMYTLEYAPIDTAILLLIKNPEYKTHYVVRAQNVYSKRGISIVDSTGSLWWYFDGYAPNEESKPYLISKQKN